MMRLCCIFLILFMGGCTGFFLHPDRPRSLDPSLFGLQYSEELLRDGRGPELVYWILPSQGPYKGTVLFLHGNAGNMSTHLSSVAWLPSEGYRVVLFDYRGYGGSQGAADLAGLHQDAERMIEFVSRLEPDKSKRILFGQSLGASVALYSVTQMTGQGGFKCVIADSPFASYRQIAREKVSEYWLLYPLQFPLGWTVTDSYSAIGRVDKIMTPILFIHGESDSIVPPHHSRQLCERNVTWCTRWMVPDAEHIVALTRLGLRGRLVKWIETQGG